MLSPTRGERQDIRQLAAGTPSCSPVSYTGEQQAASSGGKQDCSCSISSPLLPRATHKAMTGQAGGIYLCPLVQAVLANGATKTHAQHQLEPFGESETGLGLGFGPRVWP